MNSRTRLACGVTIGYLLGRTRKMRLALMVAGMTGAAASPRQLVERGLKQLASVPEVGNLTTIARGQLVDAAKTAAITAASSRIDALNERLQGKPGTGEAVAPDGEEEPRRSTGKEHADTDEDTSAESPAGRDDEPHDEEPVEDGEENSGDAPPRSRGRANSTSRRRASADEPEDKPRRTTRRSTRAPVRRAGR